MTTRDNEFRSDDKDNHTEQPNDDKPTAYRVEDEHNLEEKDLKRNYLFGEGKMKSADAPGMEGQGMGGSKFGQNNVTPAGDDKANPSQNAGYDNAYFRRNEPAEEHPENSNFVAEQQQGGADKNVGQPNIPGPNELPDQQKVGENTEQNKPNPQQNYSEGTADNDGQKGDQSKKSSDNSARDAKKDHIET
jgi:hypothetical protein